MFLVSELLEGQTRRQRLARGALPWRNAVDYASQLCTGLAAAHQRGIVHCDLKPENLFITAADRIKILDFGLARLTEERPGEPPPSATLTLYSDAAIRGTLGYLAPEQVRRGEVDERAPTCSRSERSCTRCCARGVPSRRTISGGAERNPQGGPPAAASHDSERARAHRRALSRAVGDDDLCLATVLLPMSPVTHASRCLLQRFARCRRRCDAIVTREGTAANDDNRSGGHYAWDSQSFTGSLQPDCLRQVPGDVPNWRLNARLNAASDS